jgi:hypothetical protein
VDTTVKRARMLRLTYRNVPENYKKGKNRQDLLEEHNMLGKNGRRGPRFRND